MVTFRIIGIAVLFILLFSTFSLAANTLDTSVTGGQTDCVYYYFSKDCVSCTATSTFMNKLIIKNPDLNLQQFEVYQNAQNAALLKSYFDSYNIPESSRNIPAVFTGGTYFIGEKAIKGLLEARLEENEDESCPSLAAQNAVGFVGIGETSNVLDTLTFFNVLGDALKDSVKQGHLALLLLLMVLLITIKDQEMMIKRAVLFLVTVYFTHLLFGMGLFSGIKLFNASTIFYKTIGVFAAIYGTISIKAFFTSYRVMLKEIPQEIKVNLKIFRNAIISITGVFILGFMGGILSLPDLGNKFVTLQNLFTESSFKVSAFPMIIYYSLISMIPLIALFALVHFIKEELENIAEDKANDNPHKLQVWTKYHARIVSVSISSVMLVIGLILIFV
ncbi:hypothetical protein COV12_03430 [Candidatus Woesearchaeota archaeon CG10_big_fil_rev_8_21_14_0_10_32_24]|nr:MAG: hypothetical protein COV12_03430 [Candidatus Woesearchaeota archaeon CG10_big_fil_rev_8_21_14_0_10_32_24]